MRPGTLAYILAAALSLASAAAHADAYDEANSGLDALKNADYDRAIGLFTHAIDSRELSGDQLEFAYASRGKAYLSKGDLSSAISDLDRARRMKPDDVDAQNDLVSALQTELPADQIPGRPKANPWQGVGDAIAAGIVAGVISGLAGSN